MPDVALGQPYTAAFEVVDANGSPVTSGVSGSMTLDTPEAASAAGPSTLVDFGRGRWGVTWTGAQIAAAGTYRYVVPTLTYGSPTVTLEDQVGWFRAGPILPWMATLREIVLGCYDELDDLWESTATGGSTTTLVDTALIDSGREANEFVGSELLLLEPEGLNDPQPLQVTAYNATTGTLTFNTTLASGIDAGADYALVNQGGAGTRYKRLRRLIDNAIRSATLTDSVSDAISLTYTPPQQLYTVPAYWLDVTRVQWSYPGRATYGEFNNIAPHFFEFDPDRLQLRILCALPSGAGLKITGRSAVPLPRFLTSYVEANAAWVQDTVLGEILTPPGSRAAVLLNRSEKRRPR